MKSVDILLFHRTQRDEDAKKNVAYRRRCDRCKDQRNAGGATVMVTDGTQKDGARGSITDVNGKFSLQVPRKASIKSVVHGIRSSVATSDQRKHNYEDCA